MSHVNTELPKSYNPQTCSTHKYILNKYIIVITNKYVCFHIALQFPGNNDMYFTYFELFTTAT